MTITELHTRMRFVSLLRSKQDAPRVLLATMTQIERHTGRHIARVRSDNANEYLTKELLETARTRGTAFDPTVPHTPQQNSVSERLNRTLLERVRATLSSMQLPFDKYWALCTLNTVEKLNLLYQRTINDIPRRLWESTRSSDTPFYPRSLDLKQFRAFGEYGYIPNLQSIKSKADPRATLVRYLSTPKTGTFQVLVPTTGQLTVCRAIDYRPYNPAFDPQRYISHALPLREGHKPRVNAHHAIPYHASSTNPEPTVTAPIDVDDPTSIVPEPDFIPSHANRTPNRVTFATDQQVPTASSVTPQLPMASQMPPPPTSLPAARKHKYSRQFRQAYAEEIEKLSSFNTFKPVDRRQLPRNTVIPRAQVRFAYKEDDDGRVIGFKARVVYPGNRLEADVHYDAQETATFSADRDSIRLIIALAAQNGHALKHIDLTSAFLHERYKGKVPLFLNALPDFDGNRSQGHSVVMVIANMYGTPQACRVYIDGAYAHLTQNGFTQCKSDPNVFTRANKLGTVTIALTIDDFLVSTSTQAAYDDLLRILRIKYQVKDLGNATRILNWTLQRPDSCPTNYHISQPHKISQFIDLVDMNNCHPSLTPYARGHLLHAREPDEPPLPVQFPFASALGVLRYIADCTRPDVAFITSALARNMKDPTWRHWLALRYVARYLSSTATHGIYYGKDNRTLQAFSDADFANCTDTRQSTLGNILTYANAPISWCSRRIKTVVTSTCAAEYISNSKTGEHVTWLRELLYEIGHKPTGPTELFNDNTAAEAIAKSRSPTRRSKYIEVRHHHIKDLMRRNILALIHMPSKELIADLLTKPVSAPLFKSHVDKLSLLAWAPALPMAVERS